MKKLTLLFLVYTNIGFGADKAFINTPVTDLVGQPMATAYPHTSVFTAYTSLPFSSDTKHQYKECPRIHQLLLHEQVEVIRQKQHEVLVRIPNAYYITANNGKPHNEFWMLKKHITYLKDLPQGQHHLLPIPINFKKKNQRAKSNNTITLLKPYTDPKTNLTYSIGTRFKIKKKKSLNQKKKISVYVFDSARRCMVTSTIPKEYCFLKRPKNMDEARRLFVQILRTWAHDKNGIFPYVFGGCSGTFQTKQPFFEYPSKQNNDATLYAYPDSDKVKTGLDCTGMILRAAQMAGLPYFYKNSTTIAHSMKNLDQNQHLKMGDILCFSGHAMVIADPQGQTIIEARSYEHGFGRLHEKHISKIFKNIDTFVQLESAFFNKKTIYRKDINGNTRDQFSRFKLLRLDSIWS